MPVRKLEWGGREEVRNLNWARAIFSEFMSTLIFVFAGQGSVLALDKLYPEAGTASGLVLVAVAHALALFVAVAIALNTSGGHVNPAVSFGVFMGGRVSLLRAIFYWVAQLLGAILASLLLRLTTDGMRPVWFLVAFGIGVWHAVFWEIVMTFGLVYRVYAPAMDPKREDLGMIGPLAIGFIVGANILAGGPFDVASMNLALAFGPALVGWRWRWRHHWIYCVGPFVGAALASLTYESAMIPPQRPHSH